MKQLNLFLSIVLFATLFAIYSCGGSETNNSENKDTIAVVQATEFEMLIKYIEDNGDYINSNEAPALIAAPDLKSAIEGEKVYLIDIRKAKDFADGHIEGAVNIKTTNLLESLASIDASSFDKIVTICYSGQSASYVTTILRLLGYNNTYALKFGMSSWNKKFAKDKWLAKVSNKYAGQLVTTANEKPKAGEYPTLTTGKTTGKEILEARAAKILQAGFTNVLVQPDDMMAALDDYFIVNYWPENMYNLGHVPTSMQYTPKQALSSKSALNTLPLDMPIITYCHTGQNGASVTAFLRVLGYDAQSLSYGANSLMNEMMISNKEIGKGFNNKMIENFPFVTSEYFDDGSSDEGSSGC